MVSSRLSEAPVLAISSSEKLDIVSIEAVEFKYLPSLSPAYEESLEILSHDVAKLIGQQRSRKHITSKLDKAFLSSNSPPPCRTLLFFFNLSGIRERDKTFLRTLHFSSWPL